jgi:hypothetical protein
MSEEISINNFVQVTIETSQPTPGERNVNDLALFTRDENLRPLGDYTVYGDSDSAARDWGIDSITSRTLNVIFSQSPNLTAASGRVIVAKLLAVVAIAARRAFVQFNDLILDNFKSISSGSLAIAVGSADPLELENLNFSGLEDFEDVASILNGALVEESFTDYTFSIDSENPNNLLFIKAIAGLSSDSISFTGELAGVNYLNAASATVFQGSSEYTGRERLQDALARLSGKVFFGVALPLFDETDDNLMASIEFLSPKPTMLAIVKDNQSYLNDGALFDRIRQKGQTNARCLFYGHPIEKFIFAAAYLSSYMTTNFNGSDTLRNLHSKSLVGLSPDSTVDQTLLEKAQSVGADVYVSTAGVGAVFCSGTNEWFDTKYGLNALRIALENVSFTTLRTGSRVPQTTVGVTIFENAYRSVCLAFSRAGLIGPGSWTLPYSFGDSDDFRDSIERTGIYIYTDPLGSQLQSNRKRRIKPTTYIAIKLQGAFNKDFIYIIKND